MATTPDAAGVRSDWSRAGGLEPKEGLALINGTQVMTLLGCAGPCAAER